MDWWLIIKIAWGAIGFGATGLILIVLWRAKGVISWNRAIQKELQALADETEAAAPARKKAIQLVIDKCRVLSRTLTPEQAIDGEQLQSFIRSIATCFFPQARRPELQITLGHLINSLEASLAGFDRILGRPGLKRIQSLNIRTLRSLYRWSEGVIQHPWVKWYLDHRSTLQRFSLVRLVILPDPFSWLFFLSRKFLVLILLKNLIVDITLFVGKLAIDTFDQDSGDPVEQDRESIEAALQDLAHADIPSAMANDPEIYTIRQNLVGFSAILRANPTWQDWKTAVQKAATVVARRHFPDADRPLEEAAIGPLLGRTRSWLSTLSKGRTIFLVRYVYQMRLETLAQAKDVSHFIFTPAVRGLLRSSFAAYGWIKWPLKIYRRVKRFSLPGIAADVGWVLGKKSALALIHGRMFDQACRELDWIYRVSAGMGTAVEKPPLIDPESKKQ